MVVSCGERLRIPTLQLREESRSDDTEAGLSNAPRRVITGRGAVW